MKGCCHDLALAHENGIVLLGGEHFDAVADARDLGRADEDGFERSELGLDVGDEALVLPAVSVAADGDVYGCKRGLRGVLDVFREQDGAGASAEGRLGADELAQLLEESVLGEEVEEGGGFATRNNECVYFVELL